MTAQQTTQPSKLAKLPTSNVFRLFSEHRHFSQINTVCPEGSVCPFLLGERNYTCFFPSGSLAGTASYPAQRSRVDDRQGSRDLTSSLGDGNLQLMTEALSPQQTCKIEMDTSDSESCLTMSPVSRSPTLQSPSDSLFDAESSYSSRGTSWSGEIDPPKPGELGLSASHGWRSPGLASSIEVTSEDLSQYFDFDMFGSDADDCPAPSKCRLTDTTGSSLGESQPTISRVSSRSTSTSFQTSDQNSSRKPSVICSACGRRFGATRPKRCLSRHVREKHGNWHRSRCEYCPSTFTREGNCNRHMLKFHLGECMKSVLRESLTSDANIQ